MVVYRLKVSKNLKDFPLKKKRGEIKKKKKKALSVHFIKFGKHKLLKFLPQVFLKPNVILETLKSHLFQLK